MTPQEHFNLIGSKIGLHRPDCVRIGLMFENNRKKKPGIHFEIIPMIDVMMILVIFLAIMAFLPGIHNAIPTTLPKGASVSEVDNRDILITRTAEELAVNDQTVASPSELIALVQQEQGGDETRRVVIAAEETLPYEEVVQLLSALQAAGIRNVALATSAQE